MLKVSLLLAALAVCAVHSATLFRFDNLDRLLEKYDKRVPPNPGQVTDVEVSLYVTRMYEFNEVDKNFNIDMYFRQRWNDTRLAYNGRTETDVIKGGESLGHSLWAPDTFFSLGHRETLNAVTTPNVFVAVKPNGEVFTSGRYSTNVPCKKSKDKEGQLQCLLHIESYGFSVEDINYRWKEGDNQDTVDYQLGNYKLVSIEKKEESVVLKSGTYKVLVAQINIEKRP